MKTRILYPKNIWYSKQLKEVSAPATLLALFLVSNDNIGLTRIFEQRDLEVCFLLKFNEAQLEQCKIELAENRLYFFYDEWVYINNDFSYCDYVGRDRVMEAKAKELAKIPAEVLQYFDDVIKGLESGYKGVKVIKSSIDDFKGLERGYKPPINPKPINHKSINHKSINQKPVKNSDLEDKAKKIIGKYNLIFGKRLSAFEPLLANLEYWLETYSLDDIYKAMENARADKWWRTRLDPVVLLRRKNPQGEAVDHIGKLMSLEIDEAEYWAKAEDGKIFWTKEELEKAVNSGEYVYKKIDGKTIFYKNSNTPGGE